MGFVNALQLGDVATYIVDEKQPLIGKIHEQE